MSREAAFMGRVTASATHEMRNVLAIIRESAGLIDDLLTLAGEGRELKTDVLRRASARVEAQVVRGTTLMDHLNRIAHAPDRASARVDLAAEIQHTVALCERPARGRELVLAADVAVQRTVEVDPMALQMLLFAAVDCGLELLPAGATMILRTLDRNGQTAVELAADAEGTPPASAAAAWTGLEELAEQSGARLEARVCGWGVVVLFAG